MNNDKRDSELSRNPKHAVGVQAGTGSPDAAYNYFLSVAGLPRAQSGLLSRREAATYLGVTEQTLAIWKCTGRYSLPCVKIGRLVKYRQCDLDAFIAKNIKNALPPVS